MFLFTTHTRSETYPAIFFLPVFFSVFIFLSFIPRARAFNLDWAVRAGNTYQGLGATQCRGNAVAVDASGNVYTVGTFTRTVNFNPAGTPAVNLTSANSSFADVFIWKLNAAGALVWVKKIGGNTANEDGWHIQVDSKGDVYISGSFRGTVNFNPGSGPAFNMSAPVNGFFSYSNGFVLKLNSSGIFVWARQISTTDVSQATALAVDKNDNIYITGYFNGSGDLNPGGSGGSIAAIGNSDVFTLKLRTDNTFVWLKTFGGTGEDMGHHLALDAQANIYLTGHFRDAADFNPGSGTFNMTPPTGGRGYFISRLDSNGNFNWAKQFNGTTGHPHNGIWTPGLDHSPRIAVDSAGNVHYVGSFTGSVDLDPGTGTHIETATATGRDVFIVKLNASGNFVWGRKAVDALGGLAEGNSIDVDHEGDVYTTGYFGSSGADFDPDTGIFQLSGKGNNDIFLSRLDANGNFISAAQMGGIGLDEANHILVRNNHIYLTGRFGQPGDYNPHPVYSLLLTPEGINQNLFTVKLHFACIKAAADKITTCNNSYTWINGHTYTASNDTAFVRFTTAAGCDSFVVLNLTINPAFTLTDRHTACDSFTWTNNGITYTASNNTAAIHYTTIYGCDSLVTLNLTLNHTIQTTDKIKACNSFTWIDGNTYTADNNSAIYTLSTAAGCDSIVTLDLSVFHPEAIITVNHTELGTTQTFTTYQWILNGNGIPGATQSTYVVDTNGIYQVAVTDENGCTDTSDTYQVNNVSVHQYGNDIIRIYPNPVREIVYINSPQPVEATLTGADGRSLLRVSNSREIPVSGLAAGVYFLHIMDSNDTLITTEKLIVTD